MTGMWPAVCLAVWLGAGAAAHAGGIPPPTEPPEYYTHIEYREPGSGVFEVRSRVQFARPDSLDLSRLLPRTVRVPRVEAMVAADGLVLNARATDPERYRAPVPRGAPLQWSYDAAVTPTVAGSPHAVEDDWACIWLGSIVLAPLVPTDTDSAQSAVTKLLLGVSYYEKGGSWGPWPSEKKLFRPASLDDLVDDYLAIGALRVRDIVVVAASCTLQVAIGGQLAVTDDTWYERLPAELGPELPRGRALVCVGPTKGAPDVRRARRSWLIRWPATAKLEGKLPPAKPARQMEGPPARQ